MFLLLNQVFDIYCFGCARVGSTFMGCWFAGVIIVMLLGTIGIWIAIIGFIIWVLSKIFGGKNK